MTTKAATSIIRKNNAPDRSHHVARGLAACLCIFGVACVFDLLVTNIGGALIQQQTGGSASGSYSQFALTVLSGTSQGNDEVAAAELSSVHSCSKGASMESIAKAHFKSQNGEDKTLLSQWFHGLCNGTYVEMGALNGVKYSNSYVFNKAMGWKGLLVELSPTSHRQLVANRPNELVEPVNVAVCKERQMIHYYVPEERLPDEDGKTYFMAAVAGIWEFNSREHREKWWPNVTIDQTTPVECVPMKDLLRRHVPERKFFDFFSLDVEGAELKVLQSIDYDSVGFGVILVEISRHSPRVNYAVKTFLQSRGYVLTSDEQNSYWFVSQRFSSHYRHILP